ncbi:MAG: serine/threonine protein phosphatase PrpC [Gammaproteobacteria bacterium]|jgi:protein phosphatase
MSVEFEIASDQIDGARDYQEDTYMVTELEQADNDKTCALAILADGMGGHTAGNVASSIAVTIFNKSFQSSFPPIEVEAALTEALNLSNEKIRASVKEKPALRGMGCTMVTAYLEDDDLYWISVGDSHLYLIREHELIKPNANHSYGAYLDMMKEQGIELEEQVGMSRNMLMSAITGEKISNIDISEMPIKVRPGDRVIVASDGLDVLGTGAIIQYSSWSATASECVCALLKAVEDANKINQDNTTLIVIDIKEKLVHEAVVEKEPKTVKLNQVTKAVVKAIYKEFSSYKMLSLFVAIILLTATGYFVW